MGDEDKNALDYRLSSIEKTLAELKDVVIENKMQSRDISDLQEKVEGFLSALNEHDKRLRVLEVAPQKEKAERWTLVIDNIVKIAVASCLTVILAKIGLTN